MWDRPKWCHSKNLMYVFCVASQCICGHISVVDLLLVQCESLWRNTKHSHLDPRRPPYFSNLKTLNWHITTFSQHLSERHTFIIMTNTRKLMVCDSKQQNESSLKAFFVFFIKENMFFVRLLWLKLVFEVFFVFSKWKNCIFCFCVQETKKERNLYLKEKHVKRHEMEQKEVSVWERWKKVKCAGVCVVSGLNRTSVSPCWSEKTNITQKKKNRAKKLQGVYFTWGEN